MPTGISLHVGVNETDPDAFDFVRLEGCVNDAAAMYYLAKARGFSERQVLIDQNATFDRVTAAIESAAGRLRQEGDVFLFTFSGHGTQVSDSDGEQWEFEDEALVLYDRILLDDVLRRRYWPQFGQGVRVILVTDCCHNGTGLQKPPPPPGTGVGHPSSEVANTVPANGVTGLAGVTTATTATLDPVASAALRGLPEVARLRHLNKFADFYRDLLAGLPAPVDLTASFLHLAACLDSQRTPDGMPHGAFTQALLDVWEGGQFPGTYDELRRRIAEKVSPAGQGPQPFIESELGQPLTPRFRDQAPVFAI